MLFGFLLQGATLGFSAAVSPGPLQAFLVSQTLARGWRKTVLTAFVPLVTDGPVIVVVLFLLSRTPDWLLRGLDLVGGLFLLYLAYGAFRTFQTYDESAVAPPPGGTFWRAALTNILSPSPWIFWSVLAGPILISAWQNSPADAIIFLVGFYGLLVTGNLIIILTVGGARRLGTRVTRALNGLAAIGLLVFALVQLWRAVM